VTRPPQATNQFNKTVGEAYDKKLPYTAVGISPLLYRDLLLENTNVGNYFEVAAQKKADILFTTPYGCIKLITSVNTPADEVLFIDEHGKTVGIIKLGGTPNIYRRIILE
jgi:hypothetical protein